MRFGKRLLCPKTKKIVIWCKFLNSFQGRSLLWTALLMWKNRRPINLKAQIATKRATGKQTAITEIFTRKRNNLFVPFAPIIRVYVAQVQIILLCRKFLEKVFNKECKWLKKWNLAVWKSCRKVAKKLEKIFAFQIFLLTLQSQNWGELRPTSWYSIS